MGSFWSCKSWAVNQMFCQTNFSNSRFWTEIFKFIHSLCCCVCVCVVVFFNMCLSHSGNYYVSVSSTPTEMLFTTWRAFVSFWHEYIREWNNFPDSDHSTALEAKRPTLNLRVVCWKTKISANKDRESGGKTIFSSYYIDM